MTLRIVVCTIFLLLAAAVGPAAAAGAAAPVGVPAVGGAAAASVDGGASLSASVSPSLPTTSSSPSLSTTASTPDVAGEPESDSPVGCVDGVCHDDELGFQEPTNLTDAELDALVDRSMARVEYLRGEQFESTVDVEVRSRESFRADSVLTNTTRTDSFQEWNDQVWEALFIVGENRRSADAIDSTVGAAVNGFYTPDGNRIVIISSTPDAPTISERTLIHELVHAFQHQRHDLTSQPYRTDTQDAGLAVDGVVEGEAGYLEARFEERCESGQWECLDEPLPVDSSSDADTPTGNQGVLLTLLQPYSDGPAYIHEVKSTEGWDGVDDRVASPPETTSTIIDRKPVETPPLDIADTATDGWERYSEEGVGGAETVGEASIYVMFWYQAAEYDADTSGIRPPSTTPTLSIPALSGRPPRPTTGTTTRLRPPTAGPETRFTPTSAATRTATSGRPSGSRPTTSRNSSRPTARSSMPTVPRRPTPVPTSSPRARSAGPTRSTSPILALPSSTHLPRRGCSNSDRTSNRRHSTASSRLSKTIFPASALRPPWPH